MIQKDDNRKEIRISDDTPFEEMARYLFDLGDTDYKVLIYGTDENTDTSGLV